MIDPKTIDDPTKFDKLVDKNANIIIKESAITAPGRAYVSDTISLKKKTVRLLDIFFKYWNKTAIIIIIKDDTKAKKNELNDISNSSFKSIRFIVLNTLFTMYISGIKNPIKNGSRQIKLITNLKLLPTL